MRKMSLIKIFAGLTALFLAASPSGARVLLGIDVLKKGNFEVLKGKKIGLITNHTGLDRKGKRTADLLHQSPQVKLVSLFSPEHGLGGAVQHGKTISDHRDEKTGLPIYSLYGKTKRPGDEMLRGLDALVFDIQDVGTRFYTYITTLAYALEEAAAREIEFFVLDRPNPVTGDIIEGEILSPDIKHFTAYLEIPVRHGLTVGEIAHWYNETAGLNAKLTVIKMEGWSRKMWWDDTGIRFTPTSPNIPKLRSAILYPGIGGLEATNVSVGRGTKRPFEVFGAPWIDGKALAEEIKFLHLKGIKVRPVRFTPKRDLYENQVCQGVRITVTDRDQFRPVDLFVYVFLYLLEHYPDDFVPRWKGIERVSGGKILSKVRETNQTAETILFLTHEKAKAFKEARKPYLLYPPVKEKEWAK